MYYGGVGLNNLITMTLGEIVEGLTYEMCGSINDKIEVARPRIFDFEYEHWTPEYKKRFETLFLKNFYFNEIGFETEGRFKFELENWLQTNMPYYVKLLQSQLFEEMIKNPFQNYEILDTTTIETERKENEKSIGDSKVDSTLKSTQNNSNNENVTGSVVESGNEKIVLDGTKDLDIDETNSNTEITAGRDETTIDTTENVDGSGSTTSGSTNKSFNRHLESKTPENRLAITTEDGQGVIEYASEITEDTNSVQTTGSDTSTNKTDTTVDTDSVTTTSLNVTNSGTKNQGQFETFEQEQDVTKSNNTSNTQQTNSTGQIQNNETGSNIQKQSINKDNEENVKTVQIRDAKGSIGVARYDELLNGYRTIFNNYDSMIFDAIRKDLFMLVY